MGLGDYWIKSNDGKVLNLFNIKEVKKGDVENNPSFFKLFNIFDTKHTDGSSGADGILDREELLSLFFSVAETARNSGHSVFEKELADKYVNQTKLSNGKTLKELNVNSDEFIDFLSMIVDDSESESSLNNLTPEQRNKFEEIKKVQGYYNLSSIQKKFILEAIKNNVHVDSIVEVVKNSPENNFNEKTFKMFQKALSDSDLNVKTFGTGLALSLLSDEQYSTAKELYLKQNSAGRLII